MNEPANNVAPGAAPTEKERTWGMLAHLSALAFFVMPPIGIVLGPLAVWLLRRDQSPYVEAHAREALNFNITVLLGWVACLLLLLVFIGVLLGAALFVTWLVLILVAAIKASEGASYHYPFALRFVK